METHPNPFGKPTEMRHSQKTSLAMGEYPQGILANIQKWDTDTFHYQRTADIGRVSVNPESLHQIASQLREPPYAERHVRWCERSENESRKKTTSFSSYSIPMDIMAIGRMGDVRIRVVAEETSRRYGSSACMAGND